MIAIFLMTIVLVFGQKNSRSHGRNRTVSKSNDIASDDEINVESNGTSDLNIVFKVASRHSGCMPKNGVVHGNNRKRVETRMHRTPGIIKTELSATDVEHIR